MRRRSWYQLISMVVLLFLLPGCFGGCEDPPSTPPKFVLEDSILAEAGKRGDAHGDTLPSVIIFEERHDSLAGQVEIAIMLNRLYHKANLRQLALEGAVLEAGAPSAQWFQKFPDANVRRDVALQLLKQGEISAAEFAAMVLPNFELRPIEHQEEYKTELSKDASVAFTQYLLAIALTSLKSGQLTVLEGLIKNGKKREALEYAITSDPWTKERYELLSKTQVVPSERMRDLAEELDSKATEVHADVAKYKQDLQDAKTFFDIAHRRSSTMVSETTNVSKAHGQAPIAMEIGSAHTAKVTGLMRENGISFAVVSPLALSSEQDGALGDDAFERKLQGRSVDPAGALGAFLDGRRKPPPVMQQPWFKVKTQAGAAGVLIARAAAGGSGQPPFNLTRASLGLEGSDNEPSSIDIDLSAMRATRVTTNGKTTVEVTYPVKVLATNQTFWMKVGQVAPLESLPGPQTSEEQTLDQALKRVKVDIQGRDKTPTEPPRGPGIVSLADDVKAAVSDKPDALEAIKVTI